MQALTDGHTKKPDSGCWEWHETRTAKGYGVIRHKGKTMAAHRSAYATFIGPLSDGMQINHKCDNPPCINPAHLYQGTQRDNVADMIARGRIDRKGVNCNGLRKLDEAMVRQIRASHMSTRKAAALFGVSQHTISDVRTGKSWGHICQI
ncbi:MAG TPA: HNH endonuclease signature motif containing protein [Nitrobacter sp.]|nr:HNH endonuclease signature motif containing protein [Nitrobacter sp.]